MKQKKKVSLATVLGIVLILCSLCLLAYRQFRVPMEARHREETVAQIRALLPPVTQGVPGLYSDPEMPALSLEGQDYIGLLEVPGYGVTLPIGSQWNTRKIGSFPCRFWGSTYDNSLVIGGSGEGGQLDFCGSIDLGAYISVTDMTGSRYTYTVTRVDRASHAETDWLLSSGFDLTIFARAPLSFEYIAVRCSLSAQ